MIPHAALIDLDRIGSSYSLLLSFLALGLIAAALYAVGLVTLVLRCFQGLVRFGLSRGFRLWQALFAWAHWPLLLALILALIGLGAFAGEQFPWLAIACGIGLSFAGVVTCLAYLWIDLERYEVARGYKALHSPVKGQELAANLVQYGRHVGVPLLIVATIGLVGGFALLNQGLYETVGRGWYRADAGPAPPGFVDFLAYTLLNLFRVVDLLGVAESYSVVHVSYVHQAKWPASTLLMAFRTFFTLVLLQQIFASVRRGRLLAETISDFWSPHPPIHERACGSLPQHGPGAVRPLLLSLGSIEVLTAEQRVHIPRIIADIGPAAIPVLLHHLDDPYEHVRGAAVGALGHLGAAEAVPALVGLGNDPSEWVRQRLAESLGQLGAAEKGAVPQKVPIRPRRSVGIWLRRAFGRNRKAAPVPSVDPRELAVSALRRLLADPSASVRTRAAEALGQVGPGAAAAAADLIGSLRDADEGFRCRAAEALGRLGDPAAGTVSALVGLLEDPSPPLRVSAAGALGALGPAASDAVPALMALLQETDESVRQAAAAALGQIGPLPEEAVGKLTNGLTSRDSLVRAQTAEALGTMGEAAAEAAPALAEALQDRNDRVRAKAAQALAQIGEAGSEAVPQLVRALRDEDTWVSALAAEALGEMGDSATTAVPALVRSLRHVTPQVRANAAEALGKMGPAARPAVAALEQAARDDDDLVRARAAFALGEVGELTATAGRVLLAALDDPNPEVRAAAVEAVGKCEGLREPGGAALLRAAGDASDRVKLAAATALPRLIGATPEAVAALGRLLEDDNPAVQSQAAAALGRLGAAAAGAGGALLKAAQTAEAEVRADALQALAHIQPPEAAEAFLAGLKSGRPDIRKLAVAGLVKAAELPPSAFPDLVEALRDPEVQVRSNVARILSRLETLPAEAVPGLLECAADPNEGVRINAALALRKAPAGEAKAFFEQQLADPSPRLRLIAAGYLLDADPSNAPATEALAELLSDPSPRLRRSSLELVESLGERGAVVGGELRQRAAVEEDPELSDLLARLLEHLGPSAADESPTVAEPPLASPPA